MGRTAPGLIRSYLAVLALLVAACAANPAPEAVPASSLEAMHAAASRSIPEAARQAHVQALIDGLGLDLEALEGAIAQVRGELNELNARGAPRPEVEAALLQFDARRKSIRARIMDQHFRLLEKTSAEEWRALAAHERAAVGAPLTEASNMGGVQLLQSGMDGRELRKVIRSQVADGARRAQMDDLVDRMEKETGEFTRQAKRFAKDVLDLMERHDATRPQLDSLYAQADAQSALAVPKLLDLRTEFRGSLSDPEWQAVFTARKR